MILIHPTRLFGVRFGDGRCGTWPAPNEDIFLARLGENGDNEAAVQSPVYPLHAMHDFVGSRILLRQRRKEFE